MPVSVDPETLMAACLAALAPYCDSGVHGTDLRVGYRAEANRRRHALPVVVTSPAEDTTLAEWLSQVRAAVAASERVFGGLAADDIELLIGQPRHGANGRRNLYSVLVDVKPEMNDVFRDQFNDATIFTVGDKLQLIYDDRLFAPDVAAEWLTRLAELTGALAGGAGLVRHALAATSIGDRAVPGQPDPPDVIDSIEQACATSPRAYALASSDETITYAELLTGVRAAASWLAARDVRAGQVIGLLAYPGRAFVAGLLGILYHGAVPAVLDAQSPAARLARAVGSTVMPVLLADRGRRDTAEAAVGSCDGSTTVADLDEVVSGHPLESAANAARVAPDAPGYLLFTSGSTGRPKGVVQTRRTLNVIADWQVKRSGAGSRPRTIQRSALSFDVALQEILSTLADGGCLYLLPDEVRHDLSAVARFVGTHGVERMFITPSGLQAMLMSASAQDLSSLREIVCAGEPLVISGTMRRTLREAGTRLDNQYGPTETHVCVAGKVEGDPFTWPDRPLIGSPLPGVLACVVDSRLRPLPLGAPGELMIAGPTVALGYLADDGGFGKEPAPSAAQGLRWYRTGDRVREHPDGRLEFLGRADQQVKIRGYRVELGEVEAAAVQSGLVGGAVAFALRRGDEVDRLGLAVSKAGLPIDKAALLTAMARCLPGYMTPRPGEIVVLDDMPATVSGKADRQHVISRASARIGGQSGDDQGTEVARIRALWHRTLGIEQSNDEQTFMELGGDSLAAVELAATLHDGFGITVSLREILEGMSFRRLRQLLSPDGREGTERQADARASKPEQEALPQLSTVDLPAFGTVSCLLPTEARHLYLDVVVCGTYAQFGMFDEPLMCVIDVGANIGLFSLQILALRSEARVIAIEPHPGLAAALRANLASRATVVEAACAAKNGERELFIYPDMPAMSSLIAADSYDRALMTTLTANDLARTGARGVEAAAEHISVRPAQPATVPARRLSEMLKDHDVTTVSLLKVDVQHGELEVLAGLDDDDWRRVERIVIEVQDVEGQAAEVTSALEARGYATAAHRDEMMHLGSAVTFVYGWAPGVRTPRRGRA